MNTMTLLKAMNELDEDLIAEITDISSAKPGKRLSRPVLIAAALIAGILLITACTAVDGAARFLQYFSDITPGKLSTEQVEYIVANTVDVNKSITQNGYTMTLKSVFSDGRDILMQFELTAPAGTVLNADNYSDMRGAVLEADGRYPLGMAMGWSILDEDRTDNKVGLLYHIESAWNSRNTFTEQNCRFYIYGLEAVWHENMMSREEDLTEGCWSYDIHFPEDCNRSISFVREPVFITRSVTVGYEKTGENTMRAVTEEQEGQIISLNLWALGAELSFRFGEEERNAEFGDLYAVLKNGEKIHLKQSFGMPDFITYSVETPIILEQVDNLLLEDGTVFPVP